MAVGGAVRDELLSHDSDDIDLEVYGVHLHKLKSGLSESFDVEEVGRQFGVLKIKGLPIDVGLPREDSKTGPGHRGFDVSTDPHMNFEKAARRRDFTVNSIMKDLRTGEYVDPYGGITDLKKRKLRHVSDQFSEDPLRVLRGAQFVARFQLGPAPETIALCRSIDMHGLPKERVFGEIGKLLLKGKSPSLGLEFLRAVQWTEYWPELHALIGCRQEPQWHPEGDVWTHTLHCLDYFAAHRKSEERQDLEVGLAVLLHDVGKPETTTDKNGRIVSPGHDVTGAHLAERFLNRLTSNRKLIENTVNLVREHMAPQSLFASCQHNPDRAVRRLATRVGRIDKLLRVVRADYAGRPPLSPECPACDWLQQVARRLRVADSKPEPIVMGRHLIKMGVEPGPRMGEILQELYQMQLDGDFNTLEDGLLKAKKILG